MGIEALAGIAVFGFVALVVGFLIWSLRDNSDWGKPSNQYQTENRINPKGIEARGPVVKFSTIFWAVLLAMFVFSFVQSVGLALLVAIS